MPSNTYTATCPKCQKTFTKEIKWGYKPKFCSRSCANSRGSMSKEDKELRKHWGRLAPRHKKGGRKNYPHTAIRRSICVHCKKEFWSTYIKGHWRKCCSRECWVRRISSNKVKKNHIKFFNPYEDKVVNLHSMWEVDMAEWLIKNNVKWLRPRKGIIWEDKDLKKRSYLPDFYLPSYNIYLDPKNPFGVYEQSEKLEKASQKIDLLVGELEYIKRELALRLGIEPS